MTTKVRKHDTKAAKHPPKPLPVDRKRILLVDDEKSILELFRRLLAFRLPNCRIAVAVNGAEAIEQFHEAHHGVIMMDLRMPVMDGQTAFLEIQKLCCETHCSML